MKRIFSIYILIFILLFFKGCSFFDKKSNFNKTLDYFKNQNSNKEIITITKEIVESIQYPLIEVRTNGILQQALMIPLSTRYGYRNYTSGSGQSITLQGAAISKTNGLDTHLISLKLDKENYLLQLTEPEKWVTVSEKEYKFLSSQSEVLSYSFVCNIELLEKDTIKIANKKHKLQKISEFCKGEKHEFENLYWVDSTGFVWYSKQWISNKNIYMELIVLKP